MVIIVWEYSLVRSCRKIFSELIIMINAFIHHVYENLILNDWCPQKCTKNKNIHINNNEFINPGKCDKKWNNY